jgi:hypothetical protein
VTDAALAALSSFRPNSAMTPDDVWNPNPFHVDGLHDRAVRAVLDGLDDARLSDGASPLGVVIRGQRGTGKTHLLGWLREQVQAQDGYFFLVNLLDPAAFWPTTVMSILEGLERKVRRRTPQLRTLLTRLAEEGGLAPEALPEIVGDAALTRPALDAFIRALQAIDGQTARDCQDTARALVLLGSGNLQVSDVGQNFLYSQEEEEGGERLFWGIRRGVRAARLIVRDLSRLLALTGPTVIAVDQIDALLAPAAKGATAGPSRTSGADGLALDLLAEGLMSLRDTARRTLTVVSCLPTSWTLITDEAIDTAQDRFRVAPNLQTIPTGELARALVEKRFQAHFNRVRFTPPYPTWPVAESAFADAPDFTPRELLKYVDQHVRSCAERGLVTELTQLGNDVPTDGGDLVASDSQLADLDARFTALAKAADVLPALDAKTEDITMPALLSAGLQAWILEHGDAEKRFSFDPPPGVKPPLHGRLRMTLDEATEEEAHWTFRAIASTNATAALTRLRAAGTMSGLASGVDQRVLFVLRNVAWSKGPKTREVLAEFRAAGGRELQISLDDLRVLSALRVLLEENPNRLQAWLTERRPTEQVTFLREALADALADAGGSLKDGAPAALPVDDVQLTFPEALTEASPEAEPAPNAVGEVAADLKEATEPTSGIASGVPTLVLGRAAESGAPLNIELEALRKHIAIFAGSGSGKTVLIRRLVEECALQGVSSIVLDPNNDLARLGDAWPEPPTQWGPRDAEKAGEYLAGTDVVVWTPRRAAGRPLSFQPLPDFASVRDDPDEFDAAIHAAVATLAPRARMDGATAKAQQGRAVLNEALRHFSRSGFGSLREFIMMLDPFPDGVSQLNNAEKLGAEMARTLTAAMVNDPLFGGAGTPVDPGVLLTPPPGKKARISVISLAGLTTDEQRQSFVNQLQMALFAWVKKHPAGDRPLGGLFVMDEAQTLAPSGPMTACTESTLALASQARKYGLGLVFATQAPKGLHNRIPGNAATQFFGLLNAPAQIDAAQEMARAKGGSVPDIGRMGTGQFYAAVEGTAFVKVQTPLCLSYHPKSPLTTEEVVARARGGTSG